MFVQEASSYRTALHTINSCTNTATFMGNGTEEGAQLRFINQPASWTWAQTYRRHQCACVFLWQKGLKLQQTKEDLCSVSTCAGHIFLGELLEGGKCIRIFFNFLKITYKKFLTILLYLLHRVKSSQFIFHSRKHKAPVADWSHFESVDKNISYEWGLK